MRIYLIAILPLMLFCLPGCGKPDAQAHFREAQEALGSEDDLPLALWHLQEYLAMADPDAPDLTLARLQLESCRSQLLSQLGSGSLAGTRIQDLELKIRLLEQQNRELANWKERLIAENHALRNALIQSQQQPSAPSRK